MKKLLIIQPWISYRGAETVSVLECYYLNKMKIQADIACLYIDEERLPPHGKEISYLLPPKILSTLFRKNKIAFYVIGPLYLWYLIFKNAHKYEFFNPHNFPSSWLCALVRFFRKDIKIVWTAHGVPPESGFPINKFSVFLWKIIFKKIDKWSITQFDAIIAVSQQITTKIRRRYQVDSTVIYPPIESNIYSNGDGNLVLKKFHISKGSFLIMHVSDLRIEKRPDVSIETLRLVLRKIGNAKLFFVGVNYEPPKITELIRKYNLKKHIIMASYVKANELKNYFAASDIVLMPYWEKEGCPVIPLQALLSNRISIVAKGSGVDEILSKENIGITEVARPEYFAEEIIRYYSNRSKYINNIMKGKIYVEKELNGKVYAKKINSLLASI